MQTIVPDIEIGTGEVWVEQRMSAPRRRNTAGALRADQYPAHPAAENVGDRSQAGAHAAFIPGLMVFCDEPDVGVNGYQIDLRLASEGRHPTEAEFEILEPLGNRPLRVDIVPVESEKEKAITDRRRMIEEKIPTIAAERRKRIDASRHEGSHTWRDPGDAGVKARSGFDHRDFALRIPVADYTEGGLKPIAQLRANGPLDEHPALPIVQRWHRTCQQKRIGIRRDVLSERFGAIKINFLIWPGAVFPDDGGSNPNSTRRCSPAKVLNFQTAAPAYANTGK